MDIAFKKRKPIITFTINKWKTRNMEIDIDYLNMILF